LLIGKPPFETSNVQTTYQRIKDNDYTFPEGVDIPHSAKSLIQRILTSIPEQRPTLQEIMEDDFFVASPVPRSLPLSALTTAPTFSSSYTTAIRKTETAPSARYPLTDTTNTMSVAALARDKKVEVAIAEAKAQLALACKPVPALSQPAVRTATHSPTEDLAAIFHDTKKAKPAEDIVSEENAVGSEFADAMLAASTDPATRKRLRSPYRNTDIALEKSPAKQRPRRSQSTLQLSSPLGGWCVL
jgi:serine/threonine protein kinase